MKDEMICVVGLGYVGLPLAIEFGKQYETIAYDIDENKIAHYIDKRDPTGEISKDEFIKSQYIHFTNNPGDITEADYIIIAVPTPVDSSKVPDFSYLLSASKLVGNYMSKGSIVIYESTVFPYATKDICIPMIEKYGLTWKEDFNVAYSPERINPGDKEHTLTNVIKIVSGDTPETLKKVSDLYSSIIDAGVYEASSIEVAESAKVIENIQRDVNIALMNELAIIFDRLNIDTKEVLDAAQSKWNFLKFTPGLVGGHCIGVDPYYLTHKAEEVGYNPEMILAGRRINDGMSKYIVSKTIKSLIMSGCNNIKDSTICIFGLTFKANCADLRNSKVFDIIKEFNDYGITPLVYDPWVDWSNTTIRKDCEFQPVLYSIFPLNSLDSIIIAVDHNEFIDISYKYFNSLLKDSGWLIDVKSIFNLDKIKQTRINYWRL